MKRYIALWVLFLVVTVVFAGCNGCHKERSKGDDKSSPTVPNGIAITASSLTEVQVNWKPSADDSGAVKGYKVYRNGQYLKTVETTSVSDIGLATKVKFCYRISAYDADGNESVQSNEVCAIL